MIKENLLQLQEQIKGYNDVTTVVTTKYTDANGIKELYDLGIRDFGENRVDAFLEKYEALKELDITWHFIGHLQTNKVSEIINKVSYVHSLDSLKLASEIDKCRKEKIKCFIEMNISGEESKYGLSMREINDFIKEVQKYKNIEIIGLMTMAPNTKDALIIRSVFNKLKFLQEEIKRIIPTCTELSMGMSNDYLIALDCGASFIRIGRLLFEGGF